eukprot:15475717-Alexandrium_andersonii.AAC.1
MQIRARWKTSDRCDAELPGCRERAGSGELRRAPESSRELQRARESPGYPRRALESSRALRR